MRLTSVKFIVFCCLSVLFTGQPALAAQDFSQFINDLKQEYRAQGISEKTLRTLDAVKEPIPRIIELDRNQPEFKLTLDEYLARTVPKARVEKAKVKYLENKQLIDEAASKYKVQARFIVALWGIETDFGRVTGGFDVVPALTTLIYDGRRKDYFKKELYQAFKILDEGHVTPANFKGSWAGAMGQSQFMPSSFNRFAVDADGDGRKDIWATPADVFASIANYLAQSGWRDDQTWGRRVKLPPGFNNFEADRRVVRTLPEWSAIGIRSADGKPLPNRDFSARVVFPEGHTGPAYLVYNNYDTILKWNRSDFFALAVGKLADSLSGGYNQVQMH